MCAALVWQALLPALGDSSGVAPYLCGIRANEEGAPSALLLNMFAFNDNAAYTATTPAAARSAFALSVCSHGASMSSRPKWPYAAVAR